MAVRCIATPGVSLRRGGSPRAPGANHTGRVQQKTLPSWVGAGSLGWQGSRTPTPFRLRFAYAVFLKYLAPFFTSITRGFADAIIGSINSSMPFSNSAVTPSTFTVFGSVNDRSNRP